MAGILGDGVARVEVELASAGRAAATLTTSSFPRPVWSRPVAAGDRVVFYYAYGVNGVLLERRPG